MCSECWSNDVNQDFMAASGSGHGAGPSGGNDDNVDNSDGKSGPTDDKGEKKNNEMEVDL